MNNKEYIKLFKKALKSFGQVNTDDNNFLENTIYQSAVFIEALNNDNYPAGYNGLSYKDRMELQKTFGFYSEVKNKLTKSEINSLKKAIKPYYEDYIQKYWTDKAIDEYINKELTYHFRDADYKIKRIINLSFRRDFPELYDFIKNRILANDSAGVKWKSFNVIKLDALPAEHSAVVSSSFTTYYYYNVELEFMDNRFKFDKVEISKSYYSGGWN